MDRRARVIFQELAFVRGQFEFIIPASFDFDVTIGKWSFNVLDFKVVPQQELIGPIPRVFCVTSDLFLDSAALTNAPICFLKRKEGIYEAQLLNNVEFLGLADGQNRFQVTLRTLDGEMLPLNMKAFLTIAFRREHA